MANERKSRRATVVKKEPSFAIASSVAEEPPTEAGEADRWIAIDMAKALPGLTINDSMQIIIEGVPDGARFSESELGTALQEVWNEIREKGAADRFGGTTGEPAFWRAFLDSVRGRLDGGTVSAEAFERLGYPEGKLALAQAAVYLARAPKDNSLLVALGRAEADVADTVAEPVPLHLRNAPTRLMRELGHGAGYRYAHDDPAAPREMTCLPPGLEGRQYFERPDGRRNPEPS